MKTRVAVPFGAGKPLEITEVDLSGHSMGGHGALMIALRNPGRFRSVSAFAPICAPSLSLGREGFWLLLGPGP